MTMDRETFIRQAEELLPHTAFAALGIRVQRYDPDAFQVAADIDERHHQPEGLLHGGVSALMAESAASFAAAMYVDVSRHIVAGVDLNATHLKAKRTGTITATARPLFRGRSTHVYAVDVTDEQGDLVCAARCTLAIRPRKDGGQETARS
jgi:1,4-dihydroxy-2-naphthoyl-CoA hydrolase